MAAEDVALIRRRRGYDAAVERTEDGRYVVIKGRRWRATDPLIPEDVAANLRRELMSVRRAVGAAGEVGSGTRRRLGNTLASTYARMQAHR